MFGFGPANTKYKQHIVNEYCVFILIIIIIIIIFIYCNWVVTRWQWLFYMYKNMKMVTTKFKSGGLHEKHVVATWNLVSCNDPKTLSS